MGTKTVVIRGGLGNQMFQYALVLSLRKRGRNVKIDTSMYGFTKMHNGYELSRVFGIDDPVIFKGGFYLILLRALNRFNPSMLVSMDKYYFDSEILNNPKRYILGYWQDERYFENVISDVKSAFAFKDILECNLTLAEEMKARNSVSLHIRRGDYAEFGMSIVGVDYYRNAIARIQSQVETPFFYVFSDDAIEAEQILTDIGANFKLITHNRGEYSYQDMFLMSQCKHNIIANSSFSWWGAWLNDNNEKIVIAPQKWEDKKEQFAPQCNNWILL